MSLEFRDYEETKERGMEHLKILPGSLEKRIYRFKDPAKSFYCPLCRTPRSLAVHPRPNLKNYIQMILATSVLVLIFYPLMQWRALVFFFVIWAGLETFLRLLFKKDVPCPHCGFDATWYKKDVKEARRRVKDFWQNKPL